MPSRPARIAFSSQPCSAMPASKRSSRWYSWRAALLRAMVLPGALPAPLLFLASLFLDICGHCRRCASDAGPGPGTAMTKIHRHALVRHSAARMYGLVNDVASYPRRFDWCEAAQVLEQSETHMLARLELRVAGIPVAFTTRNRLERPTQIALHLVDGPFSSLEGQWRFHSLAEDACKVSLD